MKRKRSVLVMLGWHDHRILKGIARYAREAQWHLPSRHLYDLTVPAGWKGDGLLARYGTNPELWGFVCRQSKRQPTVIIGRDLGGLDVPYLTSDDVAIGRLAARHFLERGHTNFAWYSPIGIAANERGHAFRDTIRQAGLDCKFLEPPNAAADTAPDAVQQRRWLVRQLQALPKPLALFVVDDRIAAEVTDVCLDSHLPIPQSVAVLGVGNLEIPCECSHVAISSVESDFEELGYRGAEMLDCLMSGKTLPVNPLIVPPVGVVARRSTDLQAAMHPKVREAVQFIKDNYQLPLQVHDIADEVMLSRQMLQQLFVRELRQPPAAHLLHVRLEHVKTLLRETNQKVRQIADACGFDSERNLRRAFHRKTGMSPLDFRQRHRVVKES